MSEEKKTKVIIEKKMSEQEINMWSILIAVLKNRGKSYSSVDSLEPEIKVIKDMIKLFK